MTDFYTNLRYQFEKLREAQICLDVCMTNVTGLMEQAARMDIDVSEEVGKPPPLPPYVDAGIGTGTFIPAIPQPASSLATVEAGGYGGFVPAGVLSVDTTPTSFAVPLPGSEVPFMSPVVSTNEPVDLPQRQGVYYDGDTPLNTGHTAVIKYE